MAEGWVWQGKRMEGRGQMEGGTRSGNLVLLIYKPQNILTATVWSWTWLFDLKTRDTGHLCASFRLSVFFCWLRGTHETDDITLRGRLQSIIDLPEGGPAIIAMLIYLTVPCYVVNTNLRIGFWTFRQCSSSSSNSCSKMTINHGHFVALIDIVDWLTGKASVL